MNAAVRQLTIAMITDTHNRIVEWFSSAWDHMESIETENNGVCGIIYYFHFEGRNHWIFYIDDNKFKCNKNSYWKPFKRNFKLELEDILHITKILVESKLNSLVPEPFIGEISLFDRYRLNPQN